MPKLTICLPHYRNPGMLKRHYENLLAMDKAVLSNIALIVVDDGSPQKETPPFPPRKSFRCKILRMLIDIPWNQDACRNLAVAQAETRWVLLTDIDHLIPEPTLRYLVESDFDPSCAYKFARVSEPDLAPYKPHPNSWFMTREFYDWVGGYDERFAGVYGTDGAFARRVNATARGVLQLEQHLIRVPREVTPDASTRPELMNRKSEANSARKQKVQELIDASGESWPVRGRTPWERFY